MKIRNTWKRFDEQYLENLKDCNGRFCIGVHVLQRKGNIISAMEFVKQNIGEDYNTFRFECMEAAYGFGSYEYDVIINIILDNEEEAKELIKKLKKME